MGRTVREVMTTELATLKETQSCMEAAKLMRDMDIGAAIVTRDDGELCGIVTDRDIVVRCVAEEMDPASTAVARVCSEDLAKLNPDDEIHDAVEVMRNKALRRIPVVENDKAVGIVSLGDLAIAEDPQSALGEISRAPANH